MRQAKKQHFVTEKMEMVIVKTLKEVLKLLKMNRKENIWGNHLK